MSPKRLLRRCDHPACPNRGRPWRALLEPPTGILLDGRWHCGPECLEGALVGLLDQTLPTVSSPIAKSHRIPLGLLLLSQGLISQEKLREALKAQRNSRCGRVGEWLRHLGAVSEQQITRALGMQWSLPVFPLEKTRNYLECAHLVPLPLLDSVGMVPAHFILASRHLYVAFADRVDYTALYAVEKMLDCKTEPCLAQQTAIEKALEEIRLRPRPAETMVDNVRDPQEMARTTCGFASKLKAEEVRVAGCGEFIWVRLWARSGVSDLLFQVVEDRHRTAATLEAEL